mmetsp:Transcript_6437/g.17484  ORF Transcript_6437/g.17484 Transcript_6437/m.17484 type:complete len:218 (-) Transcript_6437:25-678(-)
MALSTLSSWSALAMSSTSRSWYTPMRRRPAPAGLSRGPRILKTVRTPRPLRTGTMVFMAGWNTGANMNAIDAESRQLATWEGVSSSLTPRACSTSAEPLLLETDLFPCLATRAPQLAATMLAAVEKLSVSAPSPPVPTMSTVVPLMGTGIMCLRIATTMPATSCGVSPFARRRTRNAATWWGSAPAITLSTARSASCKVRSLRSTSCSIVCLRLVMG